MCVCEIGTIAIASTPILGKRYQNQTSVSDSYRTSLSPPCDSVSQLKSVRSDRDRTVHNLSLKQKKQVGGWSDLF